MDRDLSGAPTPCTSAAGLWCSISYKNRSHHGGRTTQPSTGFSNAVFMLNNKYEELPPPCSFTNCIEENDKQTDLEI
eukprot:scaffold529_cov196-Alexandrium_tamarense.AAC.27